MTRYLLDTNIISNVTKPTPSEQLVSWMDRQSDETLFISSLTVAEIRRGVLEKPAGKNWARLMAEGTVRGQPRSALDMIIASIAEANDCIVVTDNEQHCAGLRVINPLRNAT
ncbi:MAG: type II toxin-antitoxin system VapC family toxin [Gammaproteobacteria bacterium]|nr:MAG: type II toxin-antitoxin system VapC family toxin [Gammaproteobacteria bacterium]